MRWLHSTIGPRHPTCVEGGGFLSFHAMHLFSVIGLQFVSVLGTTKDVESKCLTIKHDSGWF